MLVDRGVARETLEDPAFDSTVRLQESADGAHYHGEASVRGGAVREVTGDSCEEVATALALVVSVGAAPVPAAAPPPASAPLVAIAASEPIARSEPLPKGSPRTGLIVSGAVLLGASYTASAVSGVFLSWFWNTTCGPLVEVGTFGTASASEARRACGGSPYLPLVIPLAGPFIAMKDSTDATYAAVLATAGLVQVGGAALLVAGLLTPPTKHPKRASRLQVLPHAAGAQAGLTVSWQMP